MKIRTSASLSVVTSPGLRCGSVGIDIDIAWEGGSEDDGGGASGDNGTPELMLGRGLCVPSTRRTLRDRDSGSGVVGLINKNSSIPVLDECMGDSEIETDGRRQFRGFPAIASSP